MREEGSKKLDGDFEFLVKEDGEAIITGYKGTKSELCIPSYFITQILDNQSSHSKNHNVVGIGDGVFLNNENLESISIPTEVINIGNYVFRNCRKLREVKFHSNKIIEIGKYAFCDCVSLVSCIIPENLTTISQRLFKNCILLKELTIPKNINLIHEEAFSGCNSLEILTILNSFIRVKKNSFKGCNNLSKLYIPSHGISFTNSIFPSNTFKEIIVLED